MGFQGRFSGSFPRGFQRVSNEVSKGFPRDVSNDVFKGFTRDFFQGVSKRV